jgi:hypothetical protein
MRLRTLVRVLVPPLLVASVFACASSSTESNNFREEVFYCEEALARLESCCPGFSARQVTCYHYYRESTGCDGKTTSTHEDPAIGLRDSQCILDKDCSALVTGRVCERAQVAKYPTTTAVCP